MRILMVMECEDNHDIDWTYLMGRALRHLGQTDDAKIAFYTDFFQTVDARDENLMRLYLSMEDRGEAPGDSTVLPIKLPWPLSASMPKFEPKLRNLVNIADIPGHPPVHVPDAEIPLPADLVHDITECDWCSQHPALAVTLHA